MIVLQILSGLGKWLARPSAPPNFLLLSMQARITEYLTKVSGQWPIPLSELHRPPAPGVDQQFP